MRQGDVDHPPVKESEWGSFDIAHTRFLLEHLGDSLGVVKSMVRAVRPGGRVILADDDFETLRLWPEPPGFAPVWRAYTRTYDRHRNDPYIGRRLVQLLHQAGAQPQMNTLVFFGACAGQPDFAGFAANLITVIDEAAKDISEMGLSDKAVSDALAELQNWQGKPDSALWYGLYWAEGIRPSA